MNKYAVAIKTFDEFADALEYARDGNWWFVHHASPRWVNRLYDVRDEKWLTYDDMIEILLGMND